MGLPIVAGVLGLIPSVLDKIFPDKEKANQAKLELLRLSQEGELKELEKRFEAIVTEAGSQHRLVALARPSFMYVMYALFLSAIPFGIFTILAPGSAENFQMGFKAWFEALPSELYWLFGSGYLGYGAYRTFDKAKERG
jgi:hypothetical protein